MVSKRNTMSLIGQAVGLVVVTGITMVVVGTSIVPAALVGLIGLFLGGWIAEKYLAEEDVETRAAGG
jgi:ABC-type Mn2+/Zn2+ transport system permease subunit